MKDESNHFVTPQDNSGDHQSYDNSIFREDVTLHDLRHYLPAQAPLKDFIHHNTLHAFQDMPFFDAIRKASAIFGYNTSLSIADYRKLYASGKISHEVLERVIGNAVGPDNCNIWMQRAIHEELKNIEPPRTGALRSLWKSKYKVDLESLVHPILFRTICSYLDQGIAVWNFPVVKRGFLNAIREMEQLGFVSFFRGKRVPAMIRNGRVELEELLDILVGNPKCYHDYLFDQQFAHQGWSGIVATVESSPDTLLDRRHITLKDLVLFELLLEIDALDFHFPAGWSPLDSVIENGRTHLFSEVPLTDFHRVIAFWQEAFEWTYYDQVLAGLHERKVEIDDPTEVTFQAIFCIDDRECSLRRYLEQEDKQCQTFGTPGFFGVAFYYQPEGGKFFTKLCPAPVTPVHLIKELDSKTTRSKDPHFSKHSHSFVGGWIISQTIGFWSALKLFANIFRPSASPAAASSFQHMDQDARLTIETQNAEHKEHDLQLGFTVHEMADRVEGVLKSIGLVEGFAPLIYVAGHGASSTNNPHYAAYDCGACSGRAGSVNARVFCHMANHTEVRMILAKRGILIPEHARFVGALHDTTRDEIQFFDEVSIPDSAHQLHLKNQKVFAEALALNARERSRRFEYVATAGDLKSVHDAVKRRSVALFEPRPELNHATNALCIIGRREITKNMFLDRRAFLNSYDYSIDHEGNFLLNIIKAAAPVCGGINLEYYFSRVDNQKLGAGTKLPHNVMGLFGVANGIDGDLRTGLPSQMIEVHDPIRLLMIIEHYPEVVLDVIKRSPPTYEWFINEWVRLVVVDPRSNEFFLLSKGKFETYVPMHSAIIADDLKSIIAQHHDNLPVYNLN